VFPSPVPPPAPWNVSPGTVLRAASPSVALHIGPVRWLLVDFDAAAMTRAVEAGAIVTDVQGKWRIFELAEPQSAQALSAAANLAAVLAGRDCATLSLFDCPTVIAKSVRGAAFLACVHASYAAHFLAAFETALCRLNP
jgi:hypothetical protein